MLSPQLIRRLFAIILVIAVPSFGCFGLYSLGPESNASAPVQFMVVAAYPVALISLGLLVLALTSPTRQRWQIGGATAVLILATTIILLARNSHLLN